MDTLYGIISMTRSKRQLYRVSLEDLDITDVIQTLRSIAAGTGSYVPDNMEEAHTIRFQVMSVLPACLSAHIMCPRTSGTLVRVSNGGCGG